MLVDGEKAEFNILSSELNGVLNIPNEIDGVRIIGIKRGAFGLLLNFETIIMPNSMTTIEDGACDTCFDLKVAVIGKNVTSIGEAAFQWCRSLNNVTIGENVTSIGGGAFYYCENLENIVIPEKVRTIGDVAFSLCDKLEVINYTGTEEQWNAIEGINQIGIKDSTRINYNYGK